MLKVTVAEVARTIVKQMGIDLTASMTYGTAVVNFSNANPFTALGRPLVSGNQTPGGVRKPGVGDRHACARWKPQASCARWPNPT